MKYIFWNVQKIKTANDYLQKLIEFYQPDIIGVAEYTAVGQKLTDTLKNAGVRYSYVPRIGSRVDLFYKSDEMKMIHCGDAPLFFGQSFF